MCERAINVWVKWVGKDSECLNNSNVYECEQAINVWVKRVWKDSECLNNSNVDVCKQAINVRVKWVWKTVNVWIIVMSMCLNEQ